MISLCRPTLSVLRAHRITFMFSVSISVYNPTGHWMINRSTHVTYPTGTRATIFQIVDSTYSPGTSLMVHYAFNACVATVSIKWGSFVFLYSRVMRVPRDNFPWRMPFYIKGAKMPTFHCGAACISPGSECAQLRVLVKSP